MKINKIKLYNFSSYEGENIIDFSIIDNKKNIILIGGKNGAGKTSLFTAIKVALYGPLAYGYVGANSYYISRIKGLINSKAFQQDKVEAGVQITVSLKMQGEIKEYVITRKWYYLKQKLYENYYVENEKGKLSEQELSYFQNYLQSIVPPDLFEFFLFDGEEVGKIFATSSYNTYVKNAVFTLCGMDVFEILRKYTNGYVAKSLHEDDKKLHIEYDEVKSEVERLEIRKQGLLGDIDEVQTVLKDLEIQLIELETAFKNAGGINKKEREILEAQYKEAEIKKSESSAKIKLFVEGMMPFLIIKGMTSTLSNQLEIEEKSSIYNYLSNTVKERDIEKLLKEYGIINPDMASDLLKLLLDKFASSDNHGSDEILFDLSKSEMSYVNGMISNIDNFDIEDMIKTVKIRLGTSEITANINRRLRSAMRDEDAVKFAEKENRILKRRENSIKKLYELQKNYDKIINDLEIQTQIKNQIYQRIKDSAQNQNVYRLSAGMSKIMEELLNQKTILLRNRLEALIVQNLKCIYRKNNLITHVEITDDFQFNLYQDETYTEKEIISLMKNLGSVEFENLIGNRGVGQLIAIYGEKNINSIQKLLETKNNNQKINLFKKIELNKLSKGERQISILSLYWAIIILSDQDIPFIIDTPYARIDASHRKEISEKFFPNISKQVIILSTDEEINEEYYKILKPYIAREYMLVNDENQNRTSIENRYFFEV